jgi:hypothetical protein
MIALTLQCVDTYINLFGLPGLNCTHPKIFCHIPDDEHREQGQNDKYRHPDHHPGIHALKRVDM